jgi:HEAT repeat protein
VRAVFLCAAFWGFAAAFSLAAQEADSGDMDKDWVRPNREALREEIFYARAFAPDMQTKLTVIAEIREKAQKGGVSPEDKSALRILRYLAGEGTLRRSQAPAPQGFPEARRASCETLGYIGGPSAREILLAVLKTEGEPMVLSEAVFALGRITEEADEELAAVFTSLLETKVLVSGGDNNLAAALLHTLEKFADSKAGIRNEGLFRVLLRMLDEPLAPQVRRKARVLIEKMKGF